MAKKISSWLLFLIMSTVSQVTLAASDGIELFISCSDVEWVEIYKTAADTSFAGRGEHYCPGNCYLVAVRLTEEAMQKYIEAIDAIEWNAHKLILDGEVFYESPDGRESYRKYAHLVGHGKGRRYLTQQIPARTYSEALTEAEKYCPALTVRGEENIRTEFPY